MPVFQVFNKRNNSWVKYEKCGSKTKILDVKQKNSSKPFKGIPKK